MCLSPPTMELLGTASDLAAAKQRRQTLEEAVAAAVDGEQLRRKKQPSGALWPSQFSELVTETVAAVMNARSTEFDIVFSTKAWSDIYGPICSLEDLLGNAIFEDFLDWFDDFILNALKGGWDAQRSASRFAGVEGRGADGKRYPAQLKVRLLRSNGHEHVLPVVISLERAPGAPDFEAEAALRKPKIEGLLSPIDEAEVCQTPLPGSLEKKEKKQRAATSRIAAWRAKASKDNSLARPEKPQKNSSVAPLTKPLGDFLPSDVAIGEIVLLAEQEVPDEARRPMILGRAPASQAPARVKQCGVIVSL